VNVILVVMTFTTNSCQTQSMSLSHADDNMLHSAAEISQRQS